MTGEIIQGPWRAARAGVAPRDASPPAEALDALQGIIVSARQAGGIAPADRAAFAVYTLALLGEGWDLRTT